MFEHNIGNKQLFWAYRAWHFYTHRLFVQRCFATNILQIVKMSLAFLNDSHSQWTTFYLNDLLHVFNYIGTELFQIKMVLVEVKWIRQNASFH